MSSRISSLFFLALLGAACHRSDKTLQRQQQRYDVVQEGANGTVTSSIGEGTATVATSTSTNTAVDTTTNFSLGNPTPAGSTSTASIAGTLPGNTATANGGPVPERIRITRRPRAVPAETSTSADEARTASSRETSRPASTDTAAPTTTTASDSSPAPRPAERKPEEPPPPPPTDTTGTQGQ